MKICARTLRWSAPLALAAAAGMASAQTDPTLAWAKNVDGGRNSNLDIARSVALDPKGNVVVTGALVVAGRNQTDTYTVKYSPEGEVIWEVQDLTPTDVQNGGYNVMVRDNGEVWVAGLTGRSTNNGRDVRVIGYTAAGAQFSDRAVSIANTTENLQHAVLSPTGVVTATWVINPIGTALDNLAWVAQFPYEGGSAQFAFYPPDFTLSNTSIQQPAEVAVDGAGNIYMTMRSRVPGATTNDVAVIKYDPNLQQQWIRFFDGGVADEGNSIAIGTDGGIYVAATTREVSNNGRATILKYNADGDLLWSDIIDSGFGSDSGLIVQADPLGGAYLVGVLRGETTQNDVLVVRYNAAGEEQARGTFNGTANTNDTPRAAVATETGIYVAANVNNTGTGQDIGFLKFDREGELKFAVMYNGLANGTDTAWDLAVDVENNAAYVVGVATNLPANQGGTVGDFLVLKYDLPEDSTPSCPADFDNDGTVNTADITAFLSAWFAARAGGPAGGADFDGDGTVNTADITAFLSAWFAARAGGC